MGIDSKLPYPYGIKIIREKEIDFITFTVIVLDLTKLYDAERDWGKNITEERRNSLCKKLTIAAEWVKVPNSSIPSEDIIIDKLINRLINSIITYGLQYLQGWNDRLKEKETTIKKDYSESRLLSHH